jgi:hypothetical protein
MTVYIEKPAIDLREELTSLKAQRRGATLLPQQTYAGDASTTDFALPRGMKPYAVFNAGSLVREGSGDDYTVSFDGFIYTVSFAVAPGSGDDVTIWPEEA